MNPFFAMFCFTRSSTLKSLNVCTGVNTSSITVVARLINREISIFSPANRRPPPRPEVGLPPRDPPPNRDPPVGRDPNRDVGRPPPNPPREDEAAGRAPKPPREEVGRPADAGRAPDRPRGF